MKASKVREMTLEERSQKVKDLQEELFNLRFQHSVGQLDNHRKLVKIKRDIARVKTVINESAVK